MQHPVRIGTRGSKLALAQASIVGEKLRAAHGLADNETEFKIIKTAGDRIQDQPLSGIGGKELFTREIENALLAGEIDMAVHSMKDMPVVLPDGLIVDCVLEREDPRDAFVSCLAPALSALPKGVRLGTASPRRAAQIRILRPDLDIVPFRGNVDTRLAKLKKGDVAATILAMAGLRRLGMAEEATEPLSTKIMLPAVAQGIIGIERRVQDDWTGELLRPLTDEKTMIEMTAERAFLGALGGSCRTPLAAHAVLGADSLLLQCEVIRLDGSERVKTCRTGPASEAARLGADAGAELRDRGSMDFLAI